MFRYTVGRALRCDHDGHRPTLEKGSIMPVLIVAIAAILGFGVFRYMRTRTAQ